MKKDYEFDRKSVEKELFVAYKTGDLKGRRTRSFLRKMARHVEHAYEIGIRDAKLKKPMIPEEAIPVAENESAMGRDLLHRSYLAYRDGYAAGVKERKGE